MDRVREQPSLLRLAVAREQAFQKVCRPQPESTDCSGWGPLEASEHLARVGEGGFGRGREGGRGKWGGGRQMKREDGGGEGKCGEGKGCDGIWQTPAPPSKKNPLYPRNTIT